MGHEAHLVSPFPQERALREHLDSNSNNRSTPGNPSRRGLPPTPPCHLWFCFNRTGAILLRSLDGGNRVCRKTSSPPFTRRRKVISGSATLDGLTRFDGVRFTVFNKSNTPGLTSNRFYCLYQDAQGDLWAGTEVGVVSRLHQGQFITYTSEHGLPKSFVSGLTGDSQGRVWVLSGNKVREWEPAAGRFRELDTPPISGGAGDLLWKVDGGFWGVDKTRLHLFVSGEWTRVPLPVELGGQLKRVAQADDGVIWIVATGARIFRVPGRKIDVFSAPEQAASCVSPADCVARQDRETMGDGGRAESATQADDSFVRTA